ncbi:helix-turn-helix domain-containing protein [Sphingomonas sp. AP4-R1]|uniref:bifunctional transcriptional activator/DNA repair enzyme AdaA n=1 Tax=Sphingomonas sp. AP4-R1 TaxID=2735134 RepID=UPI001493BCA9|nr:Ada metal-binding domain-containing protein [Sphingomonas sp. AP4-R1]QJU58803.1 helix-turn-helix domain-containing protein [Sphingomonas sp. AP4-R1]
MIEDAMRIDEAEAWRAVRARDRTADGRFVTGVLSTGIYCRPSCAARHPRRENVRFHPDPAAARAAGLRPCLRCRPDDVAADELAIARAIALIAEAEMPPSLTEMAEVAGYSPHHFHRLFRRATGVTPAAYARAVRARRVEQALAAEPDVTAAVYAAGYAAPARFYADADRRLGMTPGAWRRGGQGEMIRWCRVPTALGAMLFAATGRGVCRLAFDEGEDDLRRRFPLARVEHGGADMVTQAARAVAAVRMPAGGPAVSDAVRRAAFEEAARMELARPPIAGEADRDAA